MRFQVPQFIEVEDKIFGPLTFKQFIYIAGGVGFCVVLFIFLPKFLAILIGLPVILFCNLQGKTLQVYLSKRRYLYQIIVTTEIKTLTENR